MLFRFNKKSDPIQVDASNENIASDGDVLNLLECISTIEGYQRQDNTQVNAFADENDVTRIEPYYFRELQDFPFLLSDLDHQSKRLAMETARISAENAVTQTALDNAMGQTRRHHTNI